MNDRNTSLWKWIAISGALAVIIGAFGAHGLRPYLSDLQWDNFQTASRYHFIHTLAAALTIFVPDENRGAWFKWAPRLMLIGMILFSGSIYLLACRELIPFGVGWLGPVTPLGGVLMIAGWLLCLNIRSGK